MPAICRPSQQFSLLVQKSQTLKANCTNVKTSSLMFTADKRFFFLKSICLSVVIANQMLLTVMSKIISSTIVVCNICNWSKSRIKLFLTICSWSPELIHGLSCRSHISQRKCSLRKDQFRSTFFGAIVERTSMAVFTAIVFTLIDHKNGTIK